MVATIISHMDVNTDSLGRFVTTLTQEIVTSINQHEEKVFIDVLLQVDEQTGCIEYHNDDYSQIEVTGYGVEKAIETVNSIASYRVLNPTTSIDKEELYKVEFLR